MKKDELLAKLLDASLTEAERGALENEMLRSPEFADEVHRLLILDDALLGTENVTTPAGQSFLNRVEDRAVAALHGQPQSSSGPSIEGAGVKTIIAGSRGVHIAIGASLATGIVALLLYTYVGNVISDSNSNVAVQESPVSNDLSTVDPHIPAQREPMESFSADDPTSRMDDRSTELSPTSETTAIENIAIAENPIGLPSEELEVDAMSIIPQAQSSETLELAIDNPKMRHDVFLQDLERQLLEKRESGNKVAIAQHCKKIGVYKREIGQYDECKQYLQEALEVSRSIGLREIEAEALGQLGLLELDKGNMAASKRYIHKCIDVLREIRDTDIQRWEKEIERIETTR